MNIQPSMLLISSKWQEQDTFRMIPVTSDCPYQEAIFDPSSKVLAIISKVPMQKYTMVHKVDDNGDPVFLKGGASRPNGKKYKEERRLLEGYQEYYIEKKEEIYLFIGQFAVNAKEWEDRITLFITPLVVPPGDITISNIPVVGEMGKVVDINTEKVNQ